MKEKASWKVLIIYAETFQRVFLEVKSLPVSPVSKGYGLTTRRDFQKLLIQFIVRTVHNGLADGSK